MTKESWICCTHTMWSCALTRPHLAVIWIASSSSVSPVTAELTCKTSGAWTAAASAARCQKPTGLFEGHPHA